MLGAIRRRDLLSHPFVTIQCFGWPLFLRAMVAGRDETFLALLRKTRVLPPPTLRVPELLGRCVQLESRARQLYVLLAKRFTDREPLRRFFETLADQEQQHYEMLELCWELASREGWLEEHFDPWRDAVPRLERQMDEVEAALETLSSVSEALRLVIRVERSEINQVFGGAVAATDSVFVRCLQAFRTAVEKHISYISDQIPRLEPDLTEECRNLKAMF